MCKPIRFRDNPEALSPTGQKTLARRPGDNSTMNAPDLQTCAALSLLAGNSSPTGGLLATV